MIRCVYLPDFSRDYKKLCKKYRSLPKDFEVFLKALEVNPTGYPPHTVQIGSLGEKVKLQMYKVRKFAVSCMKQSNSGIRIIYAYDAKKAQIEFVEFIEIYHKNEQENHSEELIKKTYEGMSELPSAHAITDL